MKDIRLGNDIAITWTLNNPNGIDLTNAVVTLHDQYGRACPFDFGIDNDVVTGTYFGKDQKTNGIYRLLLVVNKGEEGMVTLDHVDAFKLYGVCDFGTWRGSDENAVETVSVELEGDLATSMQTEGGGDMSNYYTKEETDALLNHKQDTLVVGENLDDEPVEDSTNPITSGAVKRLPLNEHGIPEGGTIGQVLKKKSDKDYDAEWGNESGGGTGLPDNYYVNENGIYRMAPDNGEVYPVIHPDLSTNPSLLPQRLGLLDIYEVMIPLNRADIIAAGSNVIYIPYEYIPQGTKIIYANAFNLNGGCASASMRDDSTKWILSMYSADAIVNNYGVSQYRIRDNCYILIRYLVERSEDYSPEPTPEPVIEQKIVDVDGVHSSGWLYLSPGTRPSINFAAPIENQSIYGTQVAIIDSYGHEYLFPWDFSIYAISGKAVILDLNTNKINAYIKEIIVTLNSGTYSITFSST